MRRTLCLITMLSACALRPYTSADASSESTTTGTSGTSTAQPVPSTSEHHASGAGTTTGTSTTNASANAVDLPEESGPLWPPVPCEHEIDCPWGNCIDPGEFVDQEYSAQKYCLRPLDPSKSCDQWHQTCPEGQKCVPTIWEAGSGSCAPVVPDGSPVGSPCQDVGPYGVDEQGNGLWIDDCDADSGCLLGVCRQFCEFDEQQLPHCPPGYSCNYGRIWLWCMPTCDPLIQDCPAGQVCVDTISSLTAFECVADESGTEGQAFDACTGTATCDPGLACMPATAAAECSQDALGCCSPFCDLQNPECPGAGQVCVEWYYDEGYTQPGLEHLGVCSL